MLALGAAVAGLAGCDVDTGSTGDLEAITGTTTETEDRTPAEGGRARYEAGTPSIGGSLNGRPHRIGDDLAPVERSDTTWLHAFLDVREKYEHDVTPRGDPDVRALRRASRELGTKLLVSLQWNFEGIFGKKGAKNVPRSGSRRERVLFEYAESLLSAIGRPIDIVVLGNEPVVETPEGDVVGDDPPLVPFTRDLKDHLVHSDGVGDPRFLLGAFNRLFDDDYREKYLEFYRQLLGMALDDDDIDGIDLHVHYDRFQEAETMLSMARESFPHGTVTVTEFSPVWRYFRYKREPIASFEGGERFVDRYGIPRDTTVTEYFEAAKDDPLSRTEAADFMRAMPWYNVNFVEDMYDLLDEYDVEVGTIGFLVDAGVRNTDWIDEWKPFQINCLFQPGLIDTEYGAHPHYLDDYRERV